MPTILDYYKYAKLASAAYIVLDGNPEDEKSLTTEADLQGRLPLALARQMFAFDSVKNPDPWTIPPGGYCGNDDTGLAATLFQNSGEKVLAIRATEGNTGTGRWQDLARADLAQIGLLGMALSQTVSMVNYILRLQGSVQ